MWASSRMKILKRSRAGAKIARSRRSRASSTPLWLAASISTTPSDPPPPRPSSTQLEHVPHGVSVGPAALRLQPIGPAHPTCLQHDTHTVYSIHHGLAPILRTVVKGMEYR